MRIRTHLSERASEELIELMELYGFSSTNHTLNILVSKAIIEERKKIKSQQGNGV